MWLVGAHNEGFKCFGRQQVGHVETKMGAGRQSGQCGGCRVIRKSRFRGWAQWAWESMFISLLMASTQHKLGCVSASVHSCVDLRTRPECHKASTLLLD